MAGATTYVYEDEQHALRVGAAGVSLDSIVLAFQDGFPVASSSSKQIRQSPAVCG